MIVTKIFGILCVVLLVVHARKIKPDEKDMVMALTEDCRKEHKITDEEMDIILEGNIPESKEGKCTLTCTMKQFNVAKEVNGKLELAMENVVKMAEVNNVSKENITLIEEIGEKCKSPAVADECEFGAEVAKCCKAEGLARGIDLDNIL